jgi:H+/Na+-translocating ferredoxin:NAD+ oxidoreductase subunit D
MTKKKPLELTLSHPPHIKSTDSVTKIMWLVVAALMPATIYSVYIYGVKALTIIIASILAAVLSEFIFKKLAKRPVTILDGSAVITGLLIAMNVPPEAPI